MSNNKMERLVNAVKGIRNRPLVSIMSVLAVLSVYGAGVSYAGYIDRHYAVHTYWVTTDVDKNTSDPAHPGKYRCTNIRESEHCEPGLEGTPQYNLQCATFANQFTRKYYEDISPAKYNADGECQGNNNTAPVGTAVAPFKQMTTAVDKHI